jgi:hypothetical protein
MVVWVVSLVFSFSGRGVSAFLGSGLLALGAGGGGEGGVPGLPLTGSSRSGSSTGWLFLEDTSFLGLCDADSSLGADGEAEVRGEDILAHI